MKIRYQIIYIFLFIFILSGCHGSRDTNEFALPADFDSTRDYEITFWAKNDTNKTQTEIYQNAILEFEKIYPNIHVNLRLYTDYGKIYNDVITNISTGTTPNVCITYPDHIATYLSGEHVVLPLESLSEDPRFGLGGSELRFDGPTKAEIIPEFLNECRVNGELYALPYMRSTEACYVNKTYVEKLGFTLPEVLTWDYVWEVSEAAMAKDSQGNFLVNGQKIMIPFIYKSTDNMMIQMLRQLDAGYSTSNGQILIFNDETKEILYTVAKHAKTGAFSTFKISSYPANFLNAGQCIFAVDSTAGATWIGTDAPLLDISEDRLVEFETAVLPVPQYDPDHPYMISQGPSVCVFNKEDPQEVLASWLFTQYLISNDVQIAYAETEGYVPVTSKAQGAEEYRQYLALSGTDHDLHYRVKIDASQLLMNNTENTFVTPVFVGSTSLRDASGQMIENVTKSVKRREKIDEAYMQKLFSDVSALYRLDQIGGQGNASAAADLGPLPKTSVALLMSLGAVWLLMGIYVLVSHLISKRKRV
ncbi:MAG: extracellular solute-binding protein [Oscillospiraceae bacterium]|nr:extracellular solute-binding protein [Oscillospiraceae bacterium]